MFVVLLLSGTEQRNFSLDTASHQAVGKEARNLLQRSRLPRRRLLGHAGCQSVPTLPQRRSFNVSAKVFPRLSQVAVAAAGPAEKTGRGRTRISGLGSAAKRGRPVPPDAHHYPGVPSTELHFQRLQFNAEGNAGRV